MKQEPERQRGTTFSFLHGLNLSLPDIDPTLVTDNSTLALEDTYVVYAREQEEALNRWSSAQFTYDFSEPFGDKTFKSPYSTEQDASTASDSGLVDSSFSEALHGPSNAHSCSAMGEGDEQQNHAFLGDLVEFLAGGPLSPMSTSVLPTLASAPTSSTTTDLVAFGGEHHKELVKHGSSSIPRAHVLPAAVNMRHVRGRTLFPSTAEGKMKQDAAAGSSGKHALASFVNIDQLVALEEQKRNKTKRTRTTAATAARRKPVSVKSPESNEDGGTNDASDEKGAAAEDLTQFEKEAAEVKRRRNTDASARFRIKKKIKEQLMERVVGEMTTRAQMLETRVHELETEICWLRGLLLEKDPRLLDVANMISHKSSTGNRLSRPSFLHGA